MTLAQNPDPQLFAALATRHGHFCPMSTLGLRIGWAARRLTCGRVERASYLIQTCAVDGIRLALECEDLPVDEQGRHRLYVSDKKNSWQIELLPDALRLAASYRLLESDVARENLLTQLRTSAEALLLKIEPIGSWP